MIRCALVALAASTLGAASELPVDRLFAPPSLDGPVAQGVQFSPDGKFITYRAPEERDATTFDLWIRPVEGGTARRLVDGSSLEPKTAVLSEAEKSRRERERIAGSHGVLDYAWEEDGRRILIPASGNLYLADPSSGAAAAVGDTAGEASDGQLSPLGHYVVYVADQNLHAVNLATGRDTMLTRDGRGTLSYGTAEFVAQEEMDRFTGYWCSPDDARIAYTRVDESRVDIVPRVDVGVTGSQVVNQRYPRAGRPNALVQLFVAPLCGGPAVQADLGPDDDIYLARVAWAKDGARVYAERESRDQTRLDLLAIDPSTGASKIILTEKQTPWIDLNGDFTPLSGGGFLWGSERSGFHHLYLYKADGTLVRAVTHGDWPVADCQGAGLHPSAVAGVDEKAGIVYFLGSVETPLESHLYAVSYREPSAPRKVTKGAGWWSVTLSKDTSRFLGSYSDPSTPPQTALYAISGERISWVQQNALGPSHPMAPYLDHRGSPEFKTIKADDGTLLYTSLTKPRDFDPAKRYPVVVSVYGGPSVQTVQKTWGADTDQLLNQAGYLVFRLDNRGSTNRGLAFQAPIHAALGGVEIRDQMSGFAYLASLPFVDPKRIGVMGWSYGGYMTLCLLCAPHSGFAAGIAGGPPSDWHLYDTHYTERYMGDPRTSPLAYDQASVLPRLSALARPDAPKLLLVHGMADDNVVFENTTRIMSALQAQGSVFDLMLYPGQRHGVSDPAKKVQLWRTYLAFLSRTLGGRP